MANKKTKLLVIEDDGFVLKALTEGLDRRGFEVHSVSDGADSLKAIKEVMPDLVILDLILPTMSGEEILKAKDKVKKIKDLPVLILTNKDDQDTMGECLRYPCVSDYLIKANFSFPSIVDSIKKAIASKV